jgi:hypothetical protein
MNEFEDRASLTDRLMMGPDGVVYALGTAAQHALRPGGTGQDGGCFTSSAETPRRDPGVIDPCFAYGAAARRDPGVIDPCFAYGAALRHDPGVVHPCFAY